jgi:hypothetical protein
MNANHGRRPFAPVCVYSRFNDYYERNLTHL